MAQFNTYAVVKRYNRPSILTKTLLEMFFSNNGTYFQPYSVSEVYILPDTGTTNGSPDIYINRAASDIGTSAYGLLNASSVSSVVATYNVSNSENIGNGGDLSWPTDSPLNPSSYSGTNDVLYGSPSSIFSGLAGEPYRYQVVGDSIAFPSFSSVQNYFDVWLVQDFSGVDASSGWHLYWNKFSVYNDRIITFTEPFEVTTRSKLRQKYIPLSSIVDLAIETNVFLANNNLTVDEKNIWREAVIDANTVDIQITRRNPQTSGERTTIQGWVNTGVTVNSSNTILYKWNTSGQEKGDYVVQVRYDLLGQTFYSEEFSLVLR